MFANPAPPGKYQKMIATLQNDLIIDTDKEIMTLFELFNEKPINSKWSHCFNCNHVFLNPKFSKEIERNLYGEESIYRKYSIGDKTLNEYLELAKIYSTPQSSKFINGILDKLLNELKKEGKVIKQGRGLVE